MLLARCSHHGLKSCLGVPFDEIPSGQQWCRYCFQLFSVRSCSFGAVGDDVPEGADLIDYMTAAGSLTSLANGV